MTWNRLIASVLVSVLLAAFSLVAQGPTATISGTVRDQSGAVLPGATVQVTARETGRIRTTVTDASGRYRIPSAEPGTYNVQASLTGFRTAVKPDVSVTTGSEVVVDLTTEIGQVSESVTVAAEIPLVQTSSAELSGLVGDKEIRDLPLNGRSYEALAFLQPGVSQFNSASGGTTARVANGAGTKMSVSGTPGDFSSFLLDGTDIHDHAGFTPGSVARNNLGVDSILEFRVFTQNYGAEYGRTGGGVISAVTRSGTNAFHGSLFEFLRNNVLDARQFFDEGGSKPFRRNQFGASAGGPIIRDRTFIYGNYEGLRERLSTSTLNTVPSLSARQGFVRGVNVGVDPRIKPYLDLWPLPNTGLDYGDGTAEFRWVTSNPTREDYGSIRIDHQFNDKFYLFGRLTVDDAGILLPGNLPPFLGTTVNRNTFTTVELKSILSPQFLNVVRVAFNRTNPLLEDAFSPANDADLTFYPGRKWAITSAVSSGGGGSGGVLSQFGHIGSAPQGFTQNIFQYTDDVDYHRGDHSMRIGFNAERLQNNNIQASQDGTMAFGSIESLLRAQPSQYTARTLDSGINQGVRQWLIGYYFQDNYRAKDWLTLNLGLRHEFTTIPSEVNGQQANILDVVHDTTPTLGTVWLQNPSLKAFEPRFGFAATPFGEHRPVIRGGFGIYHNQLMGRVYYNYARSAFQKNATINNPLFPRPGLESVSTGSVSYSTWTAYPKTPTVYQYNFTLEQEIAGGVVVTAGYVGTHGFHWVRDTSPNIRPPQYTSDGRVFFTGAGNRINPAFGNVRQVTTDSVSNYNGLQVQITRRGGQRMQFQTSYTWAKTTTDAVAWGNAHTTNTSSIAMLFFDRHADKSLASQHQSQIFSFNTTYKLPGNSLQGIAAVLAKGWEASGIIKAGSGTPVSIEVGSSRANDSNSDVPDRPDLVAGARNNPVEGATVGCKASPADTGIAAGQKLGGPDRYYDPCSFSVPAVNFYGNSGRNTVIGPGIMTIDVSLVKTFPLFEGHTLSFRSEFFNLANHANFGLPIRSVFTSTGSGAGAVFSYAGVAGKIQDLTTPSRQIQFSLRYTF